MKIDLKRRRSGEVLFSVDADSFKLAVEAANTTKVDLAEVNLLETDLAGANLNGARLSGANLTATNLTGANLSGCDLSEAELGEANLSWAKLSGANLNGAKLRETNLNWTDLKGASLDRANLVEANLRAIKHDVWGVLLHARAEVPFVRKAILSGKINGSIYAGECACLCGTIAQARQVSLRELDFIVDSNSLAERFFLAINEGVTPDISPAARLALEWIDEFISLTR